MIEEWYESLVSDCRDIVVEKEFESRWSLIDGYHQLGERIATDEHFTQNAKGNARSLQVLAKNIGIGQRTVYYAIKFYTEFPDLNLLHEGKNTSWSKIIKTYLLPEKTQGECEHEPLIICMHCKKKLDDYTAVRNTLMESTS